MDRGPQLYSRFRGTSVRSGHDHLQGLLTTSAFSAATSSSPTSVLPELPSPVGLGALHPAGPSMPLSISPHRSNPSSCDMVGCVFLGDSGQQQPPASQPLLAGSCRASPWARKASPPAASAWRDPCVRNASSASNGSNDSNSNPASLLFPRANSKSSWIDDAILHRTLPGVSSCRASPGTFILPGRSSSSPSSSSLSAPAQQPEMTGLRPSCYGMRAPLSPPHVRPPMPFFQHPGQWGAGCPSSAVHQATVPVTCADVAAVPMPHAYQEHPMAGTATTAADTHILTDCNEDLQEDMWLVHPVDQSYRYHLVSVESGSMRLSLTPELRPIFEPLVEGRCDITTASASVLLDTLLVLCSRYAARSAPEISYYSPSDGPRCFRTPGLFLVRVVLNSPICRIRWKPVRKSDMLAVWVPSRRRLKEHIVHKLYSLSDKAVGRRGLEHVQSNAVGGKSSRFALLVVGTKNKVKADNGRSRRPKEGDVDETPHLAIEGLSPSDVFPGDLAFAGRTEHDEDGEIADRRATNRELEQDGGGSDSEDDNSDGDSL